MQTLSVNAYQLPKEQHSAAVELVCENRYVRVSMSTQDGGSASVSRSEGAEAVAVAGPFGAKEAAVLNAVREGEGDARAFLGGIDGATGLTWELQARLDARSAAASLHWKLFNRRMTPTLGMPLRVGLPEPARAFAGGAYAAVGDCTVVLVVDDRVAAMDFEDGGVLVEACAPVLLPPLRTRVVACAVHFVSAPGVPVAANEHFVALHDAEEGKLRLHAAQETLSAKVFLQLASGEMVEAPLSAYPERAADYALRGLGAPPKRILIRGNGGESLMEAAIDFAKGDDNHASATRATLHVEWDEWEQLPLARGLHALAEGRQADAERLLLAATHAPGLEHVAWFALGVSAMRSERWLLAAADFEESLLYCGSNPLAWWLKNWCLRRVGDEDEHDLPNAHFLAPVEPCLRIEAFLSGGGEGMLEEFGDDPAPFLEVADLLWWCGQEAERQMVLAAGAEQTSDGLLYRLRASWLRRCGMEMEAAEEERRAATASRSTAPQRISEVMELG